MPRPDDWRDSETVDHSLILTFNDKGERLFSPLRTIGSPIIPTMPQQSSSLHLQVPSGKPSPVSRNSSRLLTLSRQNSSKYPVGDFRNQTSEEINDIKCEVMVNWLHSQQEEKLWISDGQEEGVVLKKSKGMYTCSPIKLETEVNGLFKAIQEMNVKV
jgi:hypothetical protein